MANKTIYVRKEDLRLWDAAQARANGELGPVIAKLLKKWMGARVILVCLKCDLEYANDEKFRFCPVCGSKLAEEERPYA